MSTPISENPFENPQPKNGGRKSIFSPMVRNIVFVGFMLMAIFLVFQFLNQNKDMKSKTYQAPVNVVDTSSAGGSMQTTQEETTIKSTQISKEDEEAMLDTMSYEQIEAYKKRKGK